MKLKDSKLSSQLLAVLISFVIPAFVNVFGLYVWVKGAIPLEDKFFTVYCAGLTAVCAVAFVVAYYGIAPHFGFLRAYKKYEGKWLQLIPGKEHSPYAIIDFKFNHENLKYEMYGINFDKDLKDGTCFQAYRFVERTFHDGFYYITDRTRDNKNGLGKISFIKSNYDNLTRAEGYFFDSGSEDYSKRFDTIMIKCNKNFYRHLGDKTFYLKLGKIPPHGIMELCKSFADSQIEIYRSKHTDNACCKDT